MNPSPGAQGRPALLRACVATWGAPDGVPKTHFSTQDEAKRPGAHADWIDPAAFRAFAADTAAGAVDCMLEAKAKERACSACAPPWASPRSPSGRSRPLSGWRGPPRRPHARSARGAR